MSARFLVEQPPVTHPTVDVIPGCSSIFCQVSWDSLLSSLISILVTVVVLVWIAQRVTSTVPNKIQVWIESFYSYVRGQQAHIDSSATFIVPLAMTIFLYILIANWIAFLPLTGPLHPANSDLNQTAAMAVVVFVAVNAYSLRVLGPAGYVRRLTRPFELHWAARLLVFLPLNIIEEIAKPLTLALRLFGNIFGGLLMLWVLTNLLPEIPIPLVPDLVSVVFVAGWKAFDVGLIGLIQAFIFALLTIIYFEQAREGIEAETHAAAHTQGGNG